MKYFALIFCLFIFSFSVFPQNSEKPLASATGIKITSNDLPSNFGEAFESFPNSLAEKRKTLLNEQITEILLENEAAARKISVEKLIENEITEKLPNPSNEQIKAIYDANRDQIGDKSLEEVKTQIIAFLRREPEQKAYDALFAQLKQKHKITLGKDVNAPNLRDFELLATVGTKTITARDFNTHNAQKLSDFEGNFFDQMKDAIEDALFTATVSAEAKSLSIGSGDLIAREITDKMREFSDEEREGLENALKNKLFTKYNAKILLEEPKPFVQNISTDDDPSQGSVNAPVTVVMFSDFECPACASVHPVLKKVIAEFGGNVRFVVRDFPLINIHKNAFRAAIAANAAKAQGKFFEYTEILYKNQDKLDDESLKKYASVLGLNLQKFELDLGNEFFAEEVRKDMAEGKNYGISGTPTIFVNGVKIRRLSAENFRKAMANALKK